METIGGWRVCHGDSGCRIDVLGLDGDGRYRLVAGDDGDRLAFDTEREAEEALVEARADLDVDPGLLFTEETNG